MKEQIVEGRAFKNADEVKEAVGRFVEVCERKMGSNFRRIRARKILLFVHVVIEQCNIVVVIYIDDLLFFICNIIISMCHSCVESCKDDQHPS
jgi:hypothetical protein